MAIVLSENFDDSVAFYAGWSFSPGLGSLMALVDSGCNIDGNLAACNSTFNKFGSKTLSIGVDAALRWQGAISISPSDTNINQVEFCFPSLIATTTGASTYTFILGVYKDGRINLRMNNVSSDITSSVGLWPVDGSVHAIQFLVEITNNFEVTFDLVIDNVSVWSSIYDFTIYGTDPMVEFGMVIVYNASYSTSTSIYDNLEVDDDNAQIAWDICPDMLPARQAIPDVTITGFNPVVGSTTFTITGSGIRPFPLPSVLLRGAGSLFSVFATVLSATETQLDCELDDPFTYGPWCAKVFNHAFCFEGEWD